MKKSTLLAVAVAAAFAAPVMAQTSSSPDKATTTPGAVTGSGVHGATNSADRPANTPKSESAPVTPAPVVTPAPSASSGTSAPTTFGSLDRNNDGYLSRDETRDVTWASRFSELDKDNDGRLSQSEYNAMNAASGASGPPLTGGTNAADRKPNTPKSEAQR